MSDWSCLLYKKLLNASLTLYNALVLSHELEHSYNTEYFLHRKSNEPAASSYVPTGMLKVVFERTVAASDSDMWDCQEKQ